jgi:hypothetical protein
MPLTLTSCNSRSITVEASLSLEAEADASDEKFALTPAALESARIKRGLDMTLHDTGTIATLNSQTEDRTGAILGNVFKIATSIAGAFFGVALPAASTGGGRGHPRPAPPPPLCNQATMDALARIDAIDAAISAQRRIKPSTPAAYKANAAMLTGLIAERQALRDGPLHVDLSTDLDLSAENSKHSGEEEIELKPLRKWLRAVPTKKAKLSWTATPVPGTAAAFFPPDGPQRCATALDAAKGMSICFLEPVPASFKATASGFESIMSANKPLTLEKAEVFPVPQWGALRTFPLVAAVGSSRQVSLTLDKFGRASELKWSSEAKLESLTGTAADLAGKVQGVVSANSAVNRNKAEIEELTTLQSLNRLRACREILDQGGSACPAEAPTPAEPQ